MALPAPTRPRSIAGIPVVVITVLSVAVAAIGAAQDAPALSRVRSYSSRITSAIADGTERSQTFRRLIDTIDATDGLVYVDEGKCGHGVSACLVLSVQLAGPHRLLRILVDRHTRQRDCELMASIGHELRHAIEVLNQPNVRDFSTAHSFYEREWPTDRRKRRFETPEAERTGLQIRAEVCAR